MKVVLLDDHTLIRKGIKIILSEIPDVEVVNEFSSAEDFCIQTSNVGYDFDLLFLDISLKGNLSGIDVLEYLQKEKYDKGVFVLSAFSDSYYVKTCIELGVNAYIIKNNSEEEIVAALDSFSKGEKYFSQEVYNSLVKSQEVTRKTLSDQIKLTKRESEILREVINGLSSNEISEKLFISSRTVDTHRFNIMKKFGVKNSAELVKKALNDYSI